MKSKRKVVWNGIFLLLVFGLTIYGVFHGEDLSAMMAAIKNADIRWLIPGIGLVVVFIWGESVIIWYMMRSFQIHLKGRICFLFSSVGFFFSCITPSASGGQPMQIYYMKKEKIPIPVATVILMVVTITYKLVLVIIGLGILIFCRGFLHRYLEEILPIYYLGLMLNVFCGFYDGIGVSPGFGRKNSGEGDGVAGKTAPYETKRITQKKTSGIHGGLQGDSSVSEGS